MSPTQLLAALRSSRLTHTIEKWVESFNSGFLFWAMLSSFGFSTWVFFMWFDSRGFVRDCCFKKTKCHFYVCWFLGGVLFACFIIWVGAPNWRPALNGLLFSHVWSLVVVIFASCVFRLRRWLFRNSKQERASDTALQVIMT